MKYSGKNAKFFDVHTVDTKTVTPALRQTVTAISKTNTQCTIFKRGSFNIKVHVVYKVLALVLAIISPRVPEVFQGRGGESCERGIQDAGCDSRAEEANRAKKAFAMFCYYDFLLILA